MNSNWFLERTLPNTLSSGLLPILVSLVGCIICLTSFRRAPRAAIWALIGFLLALVSSLFINLSFDLLIDTTVSNNWSTSDRRSAQLGLSVVWSLVRAISYVFLLIAVFAQRQAPYPQQPSPQQWGGYPPPPRA